MNSKVVPKTVVPKQALALKPTSSKLNMSEEVTGVAEIAERLKFQREDPNGDEDSERESNKIPAIPRRRHRQVRREQLSPATPHWTNVWLLNIFSKIESMKPSITDENGGADGVSERTPKGMYWLNCFFSPFFESPPFRCLTPS